MNKYVWNNVGTFNQKTGGNKARKDVVYFSSLEGYKPITYKNSKNIILKLFLLIFNIISFPFLIKRNSLFLIQYPFNFGQRIILNLYKKLMRLHCIVLIHDLESVRMGSNDIQERSDLKLADYLIVLNDPLKNLLSINFRLTKKISTLNLWDYKIIKRITIIEKIKNLGLDSNRLKVLIAGNLNSEKTTYLRDLGKVQDVDFLLLGDHYDNSLLNSKNIHFLGTFEPDNPPDFSCFSNLYGLVWDGLSIETCSGNYGKYLEINLPHKTSFYLLNSLPVIVWSHAAIAEFILSHNLGIAIDSLYEIPDKIDTMKVKVDIKNIDETLKKITSGYFLKSAIKRVLNDN